MIVKINVNDGWVFLGDVYNVEIRKNCKEITEDGQTYFLTDTKAKFSPDDIIRNIYYTGKEAERDFKLVSCFRNNNNPISYAFDTVGYLMDGKGHTIEAI
jgi:hypothetical protein